MFNRSKIMKRAWELFARKYNFPATPFKDIGRNCFAHCLKLAWHEAKKAARIAAIPLHERKARIEAIRSQISMLKFKSYRYDIGKEETKLNAEIAALKMAA